MLIVGIDLVPGRLGDKERMPRLTRRELGSSSPCHKPMGLDLAYRPVLGDYSACSLRLVRADPPWGIYSV